MVEAARLCASEPQDRDKQEALLRAAEELRYIAVDYAQGQDLAGAQVARLHESAKQATSSATQLIASAHNATQYNTNKYSQEALLAECAALGEQAARLREAGGAFAARPNHAPASLDLITAAEGFLQPSGHVAQAARAVLPTVAEPAANKQLADTAHLFSATCSDLRSAVGRARASCRGLEMDAAAEILRSLQAEIDEMERAAAAFELRPIPEQTDSKCTKIISSGRQVVTSSLTLVESVKRYLVTSEEVDYANIVSMAKSVSQSVEQTLEAVPSHTELDGALDDVAHTLHILDAGDLPRSDRPYGELQAELNSAAVGLSSASSDVAAAAEAGGLSAAGRHFGDAFNRLMGVSLELAGQTELQAELNSAAVGLSSASSDVAAAAEAGGLSAAGRHFVRSVQ
ncbi:talin-2-like [Zerene cesonia]|uniref:talin-2-like n=1 Tax=Zerene cesonia TaxID=33412 RepID=UPI0018E56BED|nr:talin-2-like [Zerene cesonia]